MFFYPKNLKTENNNPWFKPWFNILLYTIKSITAKLLLLPDYQGVFVDWWGMNLNYYYIISKAYLAIILDNP